MDKKILVIPLILTMLMGLIPIAYALSTVDASATNDATLPSNMRLTAYDQGYWWVFYWDGTNYVYKSSVDGTVWGTKTTVFGLRTIPSIWVDLSTHQIYYIRIFPNSDNFIYRNGTLGTNGIISWNDEQTHDLGISGLLDTNGYIMKTVIGDPKLYTCMSVNDGGTHHLIVHRLDIATSVWTVTPIFDYTGSTTPLACNILEVTNGITLTYQDNTDNGVVNIQTSDDNGDTWNSIRNPPSNYFFSRLSAIARANTVHYVGRSGSTIQYFNYTMGNDNTSIETQLFNSAPTSVQLSKHSTSFLQMFYAVGSDIRSRNSTNNGLAWFPEVIQSSSESTPSYLQSVYAHPTNIGASWTNIATNDVRFDNILLVETELITAIDNFNLVDNLLAFIQNLRVLVDSFNLTDTITDVIEGIGLFFEDQFHLTERLLVIFDVTIKILVDAFQLIDTLIPSTPDQELPTPIPNRQELNPSLFYTGTNTGYLVTVIVMPIAILLTILLFANSIRILAGIITIPIFVFILLMLVYIGLIPNWIIILIILMIAGLVTSIINKLTGGTGTTE